MKVRLHGGRWLDVMWGAGLQQQRMHCVHAGLKARMGCQSPMWKGSWELPSMCHGLKTPELVMQAVGRCGANVAFLLLIITRFKIVIGPHTRRAESCPDVSRFWMH